MILLFKAFYAASRKKQYSVKKNPDHIAGFTMVEILVVLVIAGIAFALVGPEIFHVTERILVKNEEKKVQLILENISMRAYIRATPHIIKLAGGRLSVAKEKISLQFKHLSFPETEIVYNANGFSYAKTMKYHVHGRAREITIPQ